MALFGIYNKDLKIIKELPFALEKEIQSLFEANLKTILGLDLVKSEFKIKNKKIDTLAFDNDSKSFVIIEYKRDRNTSVFDQGVTYLNLMLQNKGEFTSEYNENKQQQLRRSEVDWSVSKVIFVSSSFTDIQVQATDFKDLSIELWEVKRFANNTLFINQIKKSNSAVSIKQVSVKNEELKSVSNEILLPTEEYHLIKGSELTQELYFIFKNAIVNIADNIEIKYKKQEVGFMVNGRIFADMYINRSFVKIMINLHRGELDDPKKIAKDVSNMGKWGNGDYRIEVNNTNNIEYIMSLVKQSYRKILSQK